MGPNQAAVQPDSTAPSEFEQLMKMLFTAITRPRTKSGVLVCSTDCRNTTLTLSKAPVSASIAHESQMDRESPKPMVARPKPATLHSMTGPARRMRGECAIVTAIRMAPTDGAARSQPSARGPACRISTA